MEQPIHTVKEKKPTKLEYVGYTLEAVGFQKDLIVKRRMYVFELADNIRYRLQDSKMLMYNGYFILKRNR